MTKQFTHSAREIQFAQSHGVTLKCEYCGDRYAIGPSGSVVCHECQQTARQETRHE